MKPLDKAILIIGIIGIIYFGSHVAGVFAKPEKEFVRYYLSHEQATINVMIQWKDHPDTIAYSSFDAQSAVWVLNKLSDGEKVTIEEIEIEGGEE